MSKKVLAYPIWALAVLVFVLSLGSRSAQAGGWATFTLDQLPENPRVGERIDLSFVARAHGRTPFDLPPGEVRFVFTNPATGERLTAPAAPSGLAPGHHKAEIVLPSAGAWEWELNPSWYPVVHYQPLTVLPPASAPGAAASTAPAAIVIALSTAAALLLAGVALVLALREPRRKPLWVAVMAGSLLLALAGGLWLGGAFPSATAQAADSSTPLATRGEELFVAKGCIACHRMARFENAFSVDFGPDLSAYKGSPEYLRLWLKNPAAVKPTTQMPNLGLQAGEIEALAAFLTQS